MKTICKSVIAVIITVVSVFGADTSVGTWKFNVAKSKTISKNPVKTRQDIYEATPDGATKVTRTDTRADGSTHNSTWTFRYDGKEYPVPGQLFDSMMAKRIDDYTTISIVRKNGGKLLQTTKNVISKDGKTRTSTVFGFDTNGDPVDAINVYDRQ